MNNRRIPIIISALAAMFGLGSNNQKPLPIAPSPDLSTLSNTLSLLGASTSRGPNPIPPHYFRSPGWKQKQRRKKARRLGLH